MVPSERKNHELSHSTETSSQSGSISNRLEGDALAQLEAMFQTQETPQEVTQEAPQEVLPYAIELPPIPDAATHIGETALAEVTPVVVPPAVVVEASQPEAPFVASPEKPIELPQPVEVAQPATPEVPEVAKETKAMPTPAEVAASAMKARTAAPHAHEVHHRHAKSTRKTGHKKPAAAPKPVATPVPKPLPPVKKQAPKEEAKPFNTKDQEALWGAKDKIKPEDVPEGALTYEQYLALRPKAQEGDMIHRHDKNGRELFYDAQTGQRVKKDAFEAYREAHMSTHEAKRMEEIYIDEALQENAEHDKKVSDILRTNAEGKLAVEQNPHLKGLSLLAEELLSLRNTKKSTPELDALLQTKEAAFKLLRDSYTKEGVDARGLAYINTTFVEPYETYGHKPYKGSASFEGKKVAVHQVIESPAGDKAYVIQDRNGEQQTVQASNVSFTQEFEVPEKSRLERAKAYFKKWAADWREFGGKAAFSARWHDGADWLMNRHVTEEMTADERQEQRSKNRRNNRLGGAAIIAGGAAVAGLSIWAGVSIHEHVSGAASAPLPETGVGVDSAQPHLGVDSQADRKSVV
jgi:hypothetical protein